MLWNKETRNENGIYYRKGNWGVRGIRVQKSQNYTDVRPPKLAMLEQHPLEVDWNEATQAWDYTTEALDKLSDYRITEENNHRVLKRIIKDLYTTQQKQNLPEKMKKYLTEL